MARSLFSTVLERAAARADRRTGWDKLPKPLGILTLVGLRDRLRHENLYDTGRGKSDGPPASEHENYLGARTRDGMFNDLTDPLMGTIGSRFGRNVPLRYTYPEPPEAMLEPNPRLVSRRLLTRETFQPATTLNVLAAAWIQFEVHDWFSHGKPQAEGPWELPLDDGRRLAARPDDDPAHAARPRARRGRADDVRHRRLPLVGRLADLRQRASFRRGAPLGRARQAAPRRDGVAARRAGGAHRPLRRRGQLLGRPRAPPLALHARAQRDLRPPAREAPRARRRGPLPEGAARQRGADGEDPHGRLDAGGDRPPDHRRRAAGELVRDPRRAVREALRPAHEQRGHSRHPGLADQSPWRSVLADGGVRLGLPDASADSGRLRLPFARDRRRARRALLRRPERARGACAPRGDADGRPLLLVREGPSRRDHPPQLPEDAAALQAARRDRDRPGGDGRPAHARARRPALQPVPAALPPRAGPAPSRI